MACSNKYSLMKILNWVGLVPADADNFDASISSGNRLYQTHAMGMVFTTWFTEVNTDKDCSILSAPKQS